jgi:crossover junction endodeoxyribonuclease RusA
MTTYWLTIPVTDPKTTLLNANQRLHWAAKGKRTRHWRDLAFNLTISAVNRHHLARLERARITAWFTFPDRRRRDVGNLFPTIKACVDGCVDAGLIPDDDDAHLDGPFLRRADAPGPVEIRLEIADLGEAS